MDSLNTFQSLDVLFSVKSSQRHARSAWQMQLVFLDELLWNLVSDTPSIVPSHLSQLDNLNLISIDTAFTDLILLTLDVPFTNSTSGEKIRLPSHHPLPDFPIGCLDSPNSRKIGIDPMIGISLHECLSCSRLIRANFID